MRFLPFFALLVMLCLFSFCKNTPKTDEPTVALQFEERTFSKQSSTCGGADTMRCATVEVTYPIANVGAPEVVKAVNDTIQYYVTMTLAFGENTPKTMEEAVDTFIKSYEDFLKMDEGGYITPWEAETNGKVLYQSPKYVTIEIGNYSYLGGAHPNSYVNLLTFDANTGKKLLVTDLISDTTKLKQLAEVKFRAARELTPEAKLTEEGYFWEGPFLLPANIAMTEQGLYFVYNAYEAAAYALGPTDFTISLEELKGILKE